MQRTSHRRVASRAAQGRLRAWDAACAYYRWLPYVPDEIRVRSAGWHEPADCDRRPRLFCAAYGLTIRLACCSTSPGGSTACSPPAARHTRGEIAPDRAGLSVDSPNGMRPRIVRDLMFMRSLQRV